jgi:hypothetical protein
MLFGCLIPSNAKASTFNNLMNTDMLELNLVIRVYQLLSGLIKHPRSIQKVAADLRAAITIEGATGNSDNV